MQRIFFLFLNIHKLVCRGFKTSIILVGLVLLSACAEEKTAEQHMQEATNYLQQDDKKAAIVSLKNTIQLSPNNAEARFLLGSLQYEFDLYDEASKELTRALSAGYSEEEIIPLLASALQRSNASVELSVLNYDADKLSLEQQLEVGYRKLEATLSLEENEKAQELLDKLKRIEVDSIYKTMVIAYELLLQEKAEEALASVEGLLQGNESNEDVLSFLSRLKLLNGETEEAINLLEKYTQLADYDIEAKFLFVNLLVQEQQALRAEPYVDDMLKLNANNSLLNQLKAVIRLSQNDFEGAQQYSDVAVVNGRNDPVLFLVAGVSAYQLENYTKAVEYLSLVENSLPSEHPALRMLAASYLQIDQYAQASDVLVKLDSGSQGDLSLFSRAGYDLIKAGEIDKANEIIKRAEALSNDAEHLTKLGVLKLSIGDVEGLADLENAVALSPESAVARSTLAKVYLDSDQLSKALDMAKKWQIERPQSVDGYLLEARVLQKEDKFEESIALIKKAEQIDADNIEVQLLNIVLDLRAQQAEAAKVKVEKLVKQVPDNAQALSAYFLTEQALGDTANSSNLIAQAASRNQNDEAIILLHAEVLASQNKHKEAVKALEAIETTRLTPGSFFQIKGRSLILSGQSEKAYEHYREWLALFPNQVNAIQGFLELLDRQGKYAEGIQAANDYLSRNENVQIEVTKAYFLSMTADAKGAQKIIDSLDNNLQQLPFVRGIKARIAILEQRGGSAVEDAKASYDASPSPSNLLVYKRTLELADKPEQAYNALYKHAQNYPDDIRGLSLLAEQQITRNPDQALQTYEQILKKAPNNPLILNNAAFLLSQANNNEKALIYSAKAHELLPENIDFADTYAYILVQQGRTQEAVDIYNSVMNDDVNNETTILNFVEALLKNGEKQSARRRIQLYNFKIKSREAKDRLLVLQATYLN